jgi:Glycerophosphoryl diester phosphodiesterase family
MNPLANVQPLLRAYSHRDCELLPPLWQSLQRGFIHVEVDVYCFFGQVFVAHDLHQLRPWKTLERLYLEPLRHHVQQHGKLFDDETKLHLFVDVKTPASSSYHILHTLLQRYRNIVTQFKFADANDKAVTVVVSGNRLPYNDMQSQLERYTVLDGRLEDLGTHTNPHVMPFISDNWRDHFRWQGEGDMPTAELERLQRIVRTAHQCGQKVRFWGTPDKPSEARENVWTVLLGQGVDLLNTDDIAGLKTFLGPRLLTHR